MASIRSITMALPKYSFSSEEVEQKADIWLRDKPQVNALFRRFFRSSQASSRGYALSLEEVLQLGGPEQREELFKTRGAPLAEAAVQQALERSELNAHDIGSIVFTSCTAPTIPSIDSYLVESVGFRETINRVPIYQQGCAGGVVGLSLASRLVDAASNTNRSNGGTNSGNVMLCSLELCSLLFQLEDLSKGQLVGSAIFADGAAAVVMSPATDGLVIVDKQSFLVPKTRHLMGYDIKDDGVHLRLDKTLPEAVAAHAPTVVQGFLERNSLGKEDVPWWLFHPGGSKILTLFGDLFELDAHQAPWSQHVLSTYGNLSSASVLFVLSEFLDSGVSRDGDHVLMVGIGPGITLELILFQFRASS